MILGWSNSAGEGFTTVFCEFATVSAKFATRHLKFATAKVNVATARVDIVTSEVYFATLSYLHVQACHNGVKFTSKQLHNK